LNAFTTAKLFCDAHGVAGGSTIVARNDFELLAEHAAARIHLFKSELPTLSIRLEECRLILVAAELPDLDGVLRERDCPSEKEKRASRKYGQQAFVSASFSFPLRRIGKMNFAYKVF
jgi:hypothetical protein